jgi:sigma-B regulation protein RsbU (phosphoserine phosphatase)
MKPPVNKQYILLGVLLLWAVIAQCTFSGYLVYSQAHANDRSHLPFTFHDYSTVIQHIAPNYRHAGISPGDELVALDGKKINGVAQVFAIEDGLRPSKTVTVTVKRTVGSLTKTLDVRLPLRAALPAAIGWTFIIGIFVVLPAIGLLVGFYIAFARPRDPLAWITLAMLASFGQIANTSVSWSIWPPWRELFLVYHALLTNTWPLWMLLFAFYFPVPFAFLSRHRWVIYAVSLVPALLAGMDIYGGLMQGHHTAELKWLLALNLATLKPVVILNMAYVAAFFALLGMKRSLLTAPDACRRLRVMSIGCGVSLTPLIPIVLGEIGFLPVMPPWLTVICLLMLLFFPLTVAYVIVVQRAMDVRMVVRSGVQYALASSGIRILQLALIVAVVRLMNQLQQQSEYHLEWIAILAVGVAVVILLGRLGRSARLWTDRRFFREAYNAERILTELSSSVAAIRDTKRLVETVAHRIADSLHVPRVAFLLDQGGLFQPAYALGFANGTPPVRLGEHATTIRTLRRINGPSKVFFEDPQSWVHGTSEPEQTALQSLGTQVLLPVSLDTKMLGIISLGSKRSELPYTKADLQLLSAVAAQTGLALENARLTESIRREVASRERLDRELEIARDVQQRLFPQKLPHVNGLDFCGYCRPAQGVGGDYYDFIHLASGSLGIAVGDVSGKGIAAALMMASLQASLRGQAIKPCDTLAEMIHHINGLVYEASATNRYATFFYAQYDPVSRKLRYVNAGHNPPLLRRARADGDGYEFLRLEEGGTVIGLFPDFPYKEAEIGLQAGDILVAFTDGISEAMNDAEEEFDEARLIEAIRTCPARSAANISSYILEHVDAFTAGAEQHDDMTIVVVRLV